MKKLLLLTMISMGFSFITFSQIPLPYHSDFETDTTGWYTIATSANDFQWDTINFISCSGIMGFNYEAYPSGTTMLYSPIFDISGLNNLQLCISHYYLTISMHNGIRIDYSTDGNTWLVLGNTQQGFNWYTSSLLGSSNLPGWTGVVQGCTTSAISVQSLAGSQQVQFRFVPTYIQIPLIYILDEFNFCSSPCICDNITSLESFNNDENSIMVYPNPADNQVLIDNMISNETQFTLISTSGSIILDISLRNSDNQIDISNIPEGLYLIQLTDDMNVQYEKLVISRNK